MQLIFLNPWGWLALLGVPVLLAIHRLQRKARDTPSTTLFLLEALPQQSAPGRRWERLRQSVPLWAQLLFVLLITLLLLEPRMTRSQQVQRIALVLDASASMDAQREETRALLENVLPPLERRANTTEWLLIDSLPESTARVRDTALAEIITSVDEWPLNAPSHDPARALRLARQLIGSQGLLLWVTDREPDAPLPHQAVAVSGAVAKPNVGFSGAVVERAGEQPPRWRWSAVVHNFSDEDQSREWWVESADGTRVGAAQRVRIEAGSMAQLRGQFPPGQERVVLCLEADALAIDDRLPLVAPRPAPLPVWLAPELRGAGQPWERLLASIDNVPLTDDPARALLRIARHSDAALDMDPPAASWRIASAPAAGAGWLSGDAATDMHPLMDELVWQGLAFVDTSGSARREADVPLLWMGARCMIWLGSARGQPVLHFDFDPARSNAGRQPSLVVLAQRSIEMLRERSGGFSQANVEVLSPLPLGPGGGRIAGPAEPDDEAGAQAGEWRLLAGDGTEFRGLLRTADGRPLMRAPTTPGLFEVREGDRPVFVGAAQFTDLHQLDLREAGPVDAADDLRGDLVDRVRDQPGPLNALWLLLLAACLLLAWWWPVRIARGRPDKGSARGHGTRTTGRARA